MQRYFALKKEKEYIILDESDIFHIFNVMRNKEKDLIECVLDNILYTCEIIDTKFKIINQQEVIEQKLK
ncbi:MAG: hypothetical protein LRY26_00660 [Bacilli bacterium]|nr:hypothetical protein [Bacilli bacterium]